MDTLTLQGAALVYLLAVVLWMGTCAMVWSGRFMSSPNPRSTITRFSTVDPRRGRVFTLKAVPLERRIAFLHGSEIANSTLIFGNWNGYPSLGSLLMKSMLSGPLLAK